MLHATFFSSLSCAPTGPGPRPITKSPFKKPTCVMLQERGCRGVLKRLIRHGEQGGEAYFVHASLRRLQWFLFQGQGQATVRRSHVFTTGTYSEQIKVWEASLFFNALHNVVLCTDHVFTASAHNPTLILSFTTRHHGTLIPPYANCPS